MRKAAIRNGDPTTTGGFVIAFSSSIHDDGRQVALHGDEATCGNCKGAYKIHGTGDGMSEKNRCVVVDGDMVLCPCNRNRVVIGGNPGIFLEVDNGKAQHPGAVSFAGTPSSPSVFDEAFQLIDGETGSPLANRAYRLVGDSGVVLEGITNALGKTKRLRTRTVERYTLEVKGI